MLFISAPNRIEDLLPVLQEIIRRSVDGTVVPLVIDNANSRVYIGATAPSSGTAGKVEITGGDLKIVTPGYGILIPSRDGTKWGRLILENPDGNGNMTISADPI